MKKKLLEYFLMFGNPGSEMGYSQKEIDKYWNRNYITVGQLIVGLILSPIALVIWFLTKLSSIKIKLK